MATYSEVIEPHVAAISEHVYGKEGIDPCEACALMKPCEERTRLLGLQDAAVSRWLQGIESEPLEGLQELSGPISDRIREDPEAVARDNGDFYLPGETRHG